ncbi:MAG: translation initiation factor IF-2 [Christensenellales bacterium]|jgi:translation initiation factor IF-2
MNGKGNVKKDKATEIIAAIKDYENKVISSFLDRIKEKFLKLEKMKDELAARKEVLQRIAEEKILNEIKSSQKEEMQDSTAEELVAPKTEIKAEREETDTHIANEEAVQIDEKAAVIDENSKIIPFIKDEGAASAVRKVEPIRTVKPVAEKKDDSSFTETSTTASHKKKGASEKIKGSKLDKRNLNKKAKIKKGYEQDSSSVVYDESGEIRKIRTRKSNADKKKSFKPAPMVIEKAVINTENITIKLLSEKIGKTAVEIIKKLLDLGIFKTINDTIDFDTAELIAAEFGITLEKQIEQTSEEKLFAIIEDEADDNKADLVTRPPIVTVMGHVDHGKTSILDYIRKSNVAAGEAGGITQHIGAYTIKANGQPITFIDTPGHEAFTAMRSRGANITDIAVIVVAGDDGVMPQTVEAINHAKAAGVSIVVAINKMDKPQSNADRVLQQLAEHDVLVEEWGGEVPAVKVSALTGEGIPELLENILAVAELLELKANPKRAAKGIIIESKLDKGKGPVATILVQNGTLKVADFIVAGTSIGKIRAMFDDRGQSVTKATPSMPVSILGLQSVPNAGDQIVVVNDEKLSKQVAEERKNREKIEKLKVKKVTLEDVFNKIEEGKFIDLNLIIKADVQGSMEALKESLVKLSNDEVKVNIVHSGVGAINESDIMLADTSKAIIIGFNIRPDANARTLAEKSGVEIKLYRIIYEAIEDITKAIKGMLTPTYKETYLGRAEVRAIYRISGVGTVSGCMVKDGKITRNAKVRLIRDNKEIFNSEIASLKRFKDDVKEVAAGFECGIGIARYNDVKEGDIIEAYIMEEEEK